MTTIGIITDTAMDVPPELVAKYQINIIPAFVNFALESIPDDGSQMTRDEFYERLAKASPLPKTSAPPPGIAEKIIQDTLSRYDHAIVIHTSRKLSSLYETSRIAIQNLSPDRVTLIDSETVSAGGGLLSVIASEMIEQGVDDVGVLVNALEAAKKRHHLYAAPNTLEYLRRSGRVSAVVAGVGELLQIKPVITSENGEIEMLTRIRTFNKVYGVLEEYCQQSAPIERMAVIHLNDVTAGEKLLERVAKYAPPEKTVFVNASAAIGVHFGQGGLGIALYRKN